MPRWSRSSALMVGLLALSCERSGSAGAASASSAAGGSAAAGSAPIGSAPSGSAPAARPGASCPPVTSCGSHAWPQGASTVGRDFTAGNVHYDAPPVEMALLTDVRAARHAGFDRIVFEFGSGAPPGFHLEYIDRPVRKCGSGEVTPIAGDGWLEVRFDPANAHTPLGQPSIANRERKVSLGVLRELEQTCDFEAHVAWVLGVSKPNRYRVQTLNDPLRLVVDIEH